ncbi:MAG: HRDC domain-containing protein [Gemmatimonadota bacterium]|nr:HRDC domain-containing protein [Gemmatimonadota bacterium]
MSRPTIHVETPGQARSVERALARVRSVAVDCEAAGYHRYSDRLCLVQLTAAGQTFVLDPLALDLAPHLRPFLEDPARVTIMHGAPYDLRLLHRDLGIRVGALTDTQVAASLLGEPAVGLQALLERHLGIRVSKRFQRADWASRPLPAEMIEYAAGDTRHLHRLAEILEARLEEAGRLSWAREEYRWLLDNSFDGGNEGPEPDPVTRFKAARRLDDRSVTALREAIAWRDRIARERDRALFRVASDAALLAAARVRPPSVAALAAVQGFPSRLAHQKGAALLKRFARVEGLPERELVPYPRSKTRGTRPDPEEEAAFERVKEVRNAAAGRLGLDRGRVMANQVLREVVAAMPGDRAGLAAVAEVRRWQVDVMGGELLDALWKREAG